MFADEETGSERLVNLPMSKQVESDRAQNSRPTVNACGGAMWVSWTIPTRVRE